MGNEKEDGGGECRSVGDLRGVLVIICLPPSAEDYSLFRATSE